MADIDRQAYEEGKKTMEDRWTEEEIQQMYPGVYDSYLENRIQEAKEELIAQAVASYISTHKHKVYLYGYMEHGDPQPYHYLIYGVDTEISTFLINPFFSPINMKTFSPGAYWAKEDKYLHWSHHMKGIGHEHMEYGYWVSINDFTLESIEVPAIYMENNTDKKHFLDKGEF